MVSQMSISQYPHKLQVKNLNSNDYEEFSECRDAPNSGGSKIQGQDNVAFVFSSMVYLPKTEKRLLIGQEVKVIGEFGEVRLTGKVARFTNDHFHARLWV